LFTFPYPPVCVPLASVPTLLSSAMGKWFLALLEKPVRNPEKVTRVQKL
jgi:hypothetical protein